MGRKGAVMKSGAWLMCGEDTGEREGGEMLGKTVACVWVFPQYL
jgi:hypothetical protein